jgi:hypothetical protein
MKSPTELNHTSSSKAPRRRYSAAFYMQHQNIKKNGEITMSKTRLEKIASYEERIAQLENQMKLEQRRLKSEERKKRDRRLYKRAGLLESLLPDTINLTDEQFNTFLHRTIANSFGRDKLAQIVAEGEKSAVVPSKPNANTNISKPQSTQSSGTGNNNMNPHNSARSGA